MLTLDGAISPCEEVAEQNEFVTRIYDDLNRASDEEYRNNSGQRASDHRQLASWLRGWRDGYEALKLIGDKGDTNG